MFRGSSQQIQTLFHTWTTVFNCYLLERSFNLLVWVETRLVHKVVQPLTVEQSFDFRDSIGLYSGLYPMFQIGSMFNFDHHSLTQGFLWIVALSMNNDTGRFPTLLRSWIRKSRKSSPVHAVSWILINPMPLSSVMAAITDRKPTYKSGWFTVRLKFLFDHSRSVIDRLENRISSMYTIKRFSRLACSMSWTRLLLMWTKYFLVCSGITFSSLTFLHRMPFQRYNLRRVVTAIRLLVKRRWK